MPEPQQRAHSRSLSKRSADPAAGATGLTSESKKDRIPYGGRFPVACNGELQFDVLVIGRNCLDYIAGVDKFPGEDQKVPLHVRLMEGGGQGGAASCCIARLEGRVALVGNVGNDSEGRFCLKRLKDFGIDTALIQVVEEARTPVAYVFVTTDTGRRTIIYEQNTLPRLEFGSRLNDLVPRASVGLLDPEATHLGRQLRQFGGHRFKIVYDCERWRDGIEDMMGAADFFIPSSDFLNSARLGLGEMPFAEKIFRLDAQLNGRLIVTHGDKGAYYIRDQKLYQVAPPEVHVVDTTGAGDNFHGAFALALARGTDLNRCVKFAVAVASLSCREYGGREGIPHLSEALTVAEKLVSRNVRIC